MIFPKHALFTQIHKPYFSTANSQYGQIRIGPFTELQSKAEQIGIMISNQEKHCEDWVTRPSDAALLEANVNLKTGLATDFLNLFNEYIMLAELVCDGSMEHDVLKDWLPIDYETHFSRSEFVGAEVVLASYRSQDCATRHEFESAVGDLISLILTHQENTSPPPDLIEKIKHERDCVAALISKPAPANSLEVENAQAAIDAMFD